MPDPGANSNPIIPQLLDWPMSMRAVIVLLIQTLTIGGAVWAIIDDRTDRIVELEKRLDDPTTYPWTLEKYDVVHGITTNAKAIAANQLAADRVVQKLEDFDKRMRAVEVSLAAYSAQVSKALDRLEKDK